MILCDSNLLLYAYNPAAKKQTAAANWLETVLSGTEVVAFCWPVLSAFVRISTSRVAYPEPLTMEEAVAHVNEWLDRNNSTILAPTANHWLIFSKMLIEGNIRGPMTTNAEIAAYAVEHGAVLHSTDLDFKRFKSIQVVNPLGD